MITDRAGLKSEIQKAEYDGKTAAEVLVMLTAPSKTRNRAPVSGQEIIAQLDTTELADSAKISDARVTRLLEFLSSQERIDLQDDGVRTLLGRILPAGPSRTAIIAFSSEDVSPLQLAGIAGEPTLHQVQVAMGVT